MPRMNHKTLLICCATRHCAFHHPEATVGRERGAETACARGMTSELCRTTHSHTFLEVHPRHYPNIGNPQL